MIRAPLFAVLLCLPTLALADAQLDRLEAASETLSLSMAKIMVREIATRGGDPAPLIAALPDTDWDADYRAAGECMLDRYRASIGEDGIDTMLTNMEGMIVPLETATLESLDELDMQPEGVSEEESLAITQECGIVELSLQRMKDSGFTDAMMKAYSSIDN